MSLSLRERVFIFADMMPSTLSNSTSMSEEASGSSVLNPMLPSLSPPEPGKIKKKRNLPGNPDPDSEVIALSPKTLMATNRFVCEVCKKGFQRDQNLQLHRRGHNLPWKLKQRSAKDFRKKVYVCPEPSCVHHDPSRALGDLTGIKKHFCRKHGEKRWRCEKCNKKYAVQSDYKAHIKTCGTREYKCDCGTVFTRKDSFITHRAFCDALAEESARLSTNPVPQTTLPDQPFHLNTQNPQNPSSLFPFSTHFSTSWDPQPQHQHQHQNSSSNNTMQMIKPEFYHHHHSPLLSSAAFLHQHNNNVTANNHNQHNNHNTPIPPHMSATAMLQAANNVGSTASISCGAQSVGHMASSMTQLDMDGFDSMSHGGISSTQYMGFNSVGNLTWQESNRATRDFLGLTGECANEAGSVRDMLNFAGAVDFPTPAYDRDHSMFKPPGFGFC